MPVTKFTLGEVHTRYYEYYRMTGRLREELSKKYNKEKVDQYHACLLYTSDAADE